MNFISPKNSTQMKRIFFAALLISLAGLLNLTAQERIYTPELSLPDNEAVDQMPDVILDWNGVTGGNTGIIKYDIQLDTDPALGSPENFETEFLTAIQTENLKFGETYYWRVRAKDGNDISGWSETRSFRVIRRVVLTGPNEANFQNDTTKLSWEALTGINEYDYQFDTVYFWKSVNSGQVANLFDVSVVDASNAWIVGAGGLILFGDGNTWVEQESNLSTDLYSCWFLDAANGWAVGKSGKIVYWNGTVWAEQTSSTSNDLLGIYMLDASHGWAVGKTTVLFYNGTSWSSQYTASKDLSCVFAWDASHVWATGKTGLIIHYNGSSWSEQATGGIIKDFSGVAFTSADHGWAIGKTGTIMEYKNGTWTKYPTELTTKDLTGIYLTSESNGYAVGKTGTLLQYDGVDWSTQSATVSTNLNSVGFNGETGFLVGETGAVIAYNNEAFTSPMAAIHYAAGDKTYVKLSELLFGTQYFWRMRAKHSEDISIWSGARTFTTRANVTLDKPNNNATDQSLDQLLQWKKQFSEDVTYEIQVDDDPAFGSPTYLSTGDISINAEFLKFGEQYSWRARAVHAFDASDWSETWKFTTINTVFLDSPQNGETNVKLSPLLSWEAQTGIVSYEVMLAKNNSFSQPLVDEIVLAEDNSFNVPIVLEIEANYYWKVRAINGLDTSGWSDIWSFTTVPPVGVDEQGLIAKLNIYPNPVENIVYIQLKDKNALSLNITLTDLVGIKVFESKVALNYGSKTVPVDVTYLQEGIYLLRVSDNESTFTRKIVIKR